MGIRLLLERFIPWLGLVVVLLISTQTTTVVGTGPAQRNLVLGKLDQQHSFGQVFVAEQLYLSGIRVLLVPPPGEREDLVTLRLRVYTEGLPDLAVVSLPVHALARQGMTTFAFEPLRLRMTPHPVTTTLQLTLEAPTLPPAYGITVIAGADSYAGGHLLVNGVARTQFDLAFQPLYQQRWLDRLLPISRLAEGRPGLLGWPPFYALLVYGYLYVLGRILMLWWYMIFVECES